MKILITGSEGLIGKISTKAIYEQGHDLVLLDKSQFSSSKCVDLLNYSEMKSYFKNIETVIHLAANPLPWINQDQAKQNIDMTFNVLKASRQNNVKRIINASSINVYDINNLYENDRITIDTPVIANTKTDWRGGNGLGHFYPMSKLSCEAMVNAFCRENNMHGLNLRLGHVNPENEPYFDEPEAQAIWLSHEDYNEILLRSINFNGISNVSCTSANYENFVDLSQIKNVLGYTPKSDSGKKITDKFLGDSSIRFESGNHIRTSLKDYEKDRANKEQIKKPFFGVAGFDTHRGCINPISVLALGLDSENHIKGEFVGLYISDDTDWSIKAPRSGPDTSNRYLELKTMLENSLN